MKSLIGRLVLLGLAGVAIYAATAMEVRVTLDIALRALLVGVGLFFAYVALTARGR